VEARERPISTADLAATSEKQGEVRQRGEEHGPKGPDSTIALGDASSERAPNQDSEELVPLFSESSVRDFRSQWMALQTGFVDEPRRSVEQADELVARLMQDLAQTFSNERSKLEGQWEQGDKVSTEDLRLVLRRYRSFFDRFLSI
jgi:hypothetical protein